MISQNKKDIRVCLINPPTRANSLRPPLGLMYISSYLSKHCIDNLLLDPKGDLGQDHLVKDTLRKAIDYRPDFVGISCLTTDVVCVLELAKAIKKKLTFARIVLGGIHPTLFPEEMLQDKNIDSVVLGEGEETLLDLIMATTKGEDLSSVDGIAFRKDAGVQVNKKKRLISDLDNLLMPAYDKVDMDFYLQPNIHLVRGIPLAGFYIFSSRGCPYRCRFCVNKNIFGRQIRYRSPSVVADEVEHLYKRYKIDAFYIYDDTFAVKMSHAMDFCDEILKRGLSLLWGCETRVNLINERLLAKMKSAGCIQLDFGIESGSERLLALLQKDITLKQVRKAVKLCKKYRMRVFSNFMINLPTETEEDLEKTLSLADELKSDISIFNITCPFPGTDIQAYVKGKFSIEDYPKMSSMVSYNTYIDFIESRCKLSSHNIPIREILQRIQDTVPTPRNMALKPTPKYIMNLCRYFSFLTNPKYLNCMIKSKRKSSYLRFALNTFRKRNLSPTKL